jgi:hypothetical protein
MNLQSSYMKCKIPGLRVGLIVQRRVVAEKMVVDPEAVGLV